MHQGKGQIASTDTGPAALPVHETAAPPGASPLCRRTQQWRTAAPISPGPRPGAPRRWHSSGVCRAPARSGRPERPQTGRW
eukprot:scaffold101289_cov37-Prasinocladus_malaysianus.AAC.1